MSIVSRLYLRFVTWYVTIAATRIHERAARMRDRMIEKLTE